MTALKIDILNVNELMSNINKYKKEYYDAVAVNYNLLDNVDSCWNDANSILFKDKLRNDRINLCDYFSSLDNLCSKLDGLNSNLESVLSDFGFRSTAKLVLKFNDSQLSDIMRRLSNTTYYLRDALYIVNSTLLTSGYKNMSSIYNLRRQINNAMNEKLGQYAGALDGLM